MGHRTGDSRQEPRRLIPHSREAAGRSEEAAARSCGARGLPGAPETWTIEVSDREAKLGGLFLRSRLVGEADEGPPLWSETANFLVAKVEGDRKACAGATWARSDTLPAPPITTAGNAERRIEGAGAGRLPGAARKPGHPAPIHRLVRGSAPQARVLLVRTRKASATIRLFSVKPTGPTLLSVSASISEGGCESGVFGSVWALWQVDGPPASPRLTLRNQPDESMTMQPTAAVDLDGDGHVELLFDGFSTTDRRTSSDSRSSS